jgi:hypothetical protein
MVLASLVQYHRIVLDTYHLLEAKPPDFRVSIYTQMT